MRNNKMCKIKGCARKFYGRGWCSMHYTRWYIHGDPLYVKSYRDPEEAFEARTMPVTEAGCLLWTGPVNKKGYGQMSIRGRAVQAHRYAWEKVHGAVAAKTQLDHRCHTPACVNPDHLRPATPSQNGANLSGLQTNNTSGYRNVTWNKKLGRWAVQVQKDGRNNFFGYFDEIEKAAAVAEEARKRLHAEFAGKG